jgi:hypothetical protein
VSSVNPTGKLEELKRNSASASLKKNWVVGPFVPIVSRRRSRSHVVCYTVGRDDDQPKSEGNASR